MSLNEVSKELLDQVTQYHAQIGHSVPREALQQLEATLLAQAKTDFHAGKYEEALNTFTHCLAVTEKSRTSQDATVRGAVLHNIASCLHHQGKMEAAQAYYEQAVACFRKTKTPLVDRIFYGDTNQRRVDFVKERLIDISWGKKPDGDKYLDENGRKRPVPVTAGREAYDDAGRRFHQDAPTYTQRVVQDVIRESRGQGHSREPEQAFPEERPGGRKGYGRCAVPTTADMEYEPYEPSVSHGADPRDDASQEQARKEWLQYHLQQGNWQAAEELVVTAEERDDLAYLVERENRVGRSQPTKPSAPPPQLPTRESGQRSVEATGNHPPPKAERSLVQLEEEEDPDML